MGGAFIELFIYMEPIVIILLSIGVILLCVELFTPGFGIAGGLGFICVVIGIVLRMIDDGTVEMFIWMIILLIGVLCLMFCILAVCVSKGWLNKTSIFDTKSSLPTSRTEGTINYDFLINKTGIVTSYLHPCGKVEIDDKIYDAKTECGLVDNGNSVVVVDTTMGIITVKPIEKLN